MFGVFCGFMIVCILVVLVLQYENSYSINTDPELKVVFPIFRAPLLLTLYFWLLSWNTYARMWPTLMRRSRQCLVPNRGLGL